MKTIKLKRLPLSKPNKGEIVYKGQLLAMLRSPMGGSQGINVEELFKRMKIIEKLEPLAEDGKLELEDAEYELLKGLVEKGEYILVDKALVEFIEDVRNGDK